MLGKGNMRTGHMAIEIGIGIEFEFEFEAQAGPQRSKSRPVPTDEFCVFSPIQKIKQ